MAEVAKEISFIIPSRERPQKLLEMLNSALNSAKSPELIEFVIYLDNDDNSDYELFQNLATIVRGERVYMGKMFSECILKATGKSIIVCNDDVVVKTKKWDDILYEKLNQYDDNVFLFYPNDLNKGADLCTFPIFSKDFFLKFSGSLPDDLNLIDLHLRDIFFQLKGLGVNRIEFLQNIVFEHLHHTLGKSMIDKTYSDRHRFANDDLFIQYADLRFNLSNHIYSVLKNDNKPKEIINTKLMSLKMTSINYFLESCWMFWNNNAPLSYRFKLWFYMIARRLYNILIYRFQEPK